MGARVIEALPQWHGVAVRPPRGHPRPQVLDITRPCQTILNTAFMPDTYPDYPSNAQLLSYIRSFAHHYDLYPHIQFNTMVESVAFQDDVWTINTVHDGQHHTQAYRWLVCASGTNWIPNRPSLKGEETFTGEIMTFPVNTDIPIAKAIPSYVCC